MPKQGRITAHQRTLLFNAQPSHPEDRREIYIMVVGETSRALNWSLYDYDRDTNPELSKIEGGDLFLPCSDGIEYYAQECTNAAFSRFCTEFRFHLLSEKHHYRFQRSWFPDSFLLKSAV